MDQGWHGRTARVGATRGVRGPLGASGRRRVPWEGAEGLGRRGRARPGARAGALAARRRGAGRFQRDGFDLGHFDQVFLPKLELQCIEG
jgi:hypothetical protein